MKETLEIPAPAQRRFLPVDFNVSDWESVMPWFDELLQMEIHSVKELEEWLQMESELEAALYEDRAWRFIRMTQNTADNDAQQSFGDFIDHIGPKIFEYSEKLRQKVFESPFFNELDPVKYEVIIRSVKSEIDLFREENIALLTEAQQRSREFDKIASTLTIELDGEYYTLQKAGTMLENKNRQFRKKIWKKITEARIEKASEFDNLYNELIQIRHKIAKNAGFNSYADYKLLSMGRFDYGRENCFRFHDSVSKVIIPYFERLMQEKCELLGVETLKPFDSLVNVYGDAPLRPFKDIDELVEKSAVVYDRLRPGWGDKLRIMRKMNHLDLENRVNKAPGGYNYSLPETSVPFIFMNSVGTQNDVTTMMHEGGHALHSFATNHILLSEFKRLPAEIAELAAMSMELVSMDLWTEFYPNSIDFQRAKREQLQRIFSLLPWIAAIDEFQFWSYDHPDSGNEARRKAWVELYLRQHGKPFDWSDDLITLATNWQKQRHIYDLPFYYIEYGIAQLGAIAIWRNFKSDPEKALSDFWNGLSMGYTRPIPEVYAAAGIKFDFSEEYISDLAGFLWEELQSL